MTRGISFDGTLPAPEPNADVTLQRPSAVLVEILDKAGDVLGSGIVSVAAASDGTCVTTNAESVAVFKAGTAVSVIYHLAHWRLGGSKMVGRLRRKLDQPVDLGVGDWMGINAGIIVGRWRRP